MPGRHIHQWEDSPDWVTGPGETAQECFPCRGLRFVRQAKVRPGYVLVRVGTGGVFADGTTNHPPLDFTRRPETTEVS